MSSTQLAHVRHNFISPTFAGEAEKGLSWGDENSRVLTGYKSRNQNCARFKVYNHILHYPKPFRRLLDPDFYSLIEDKLAMEHFG